MTVSAEDQDFEGMDPAVRRRERLVATANPESALDYLSILQGETPDAAARLTVSYVPDKLTVSVDSFADYLSGFEAEIFQSLESLALAVLKDINNEIVPRWVQVAATRTGEHATEHHVVVEDRQPKWDNPALLSRLQRR